MFDFKCGDRDDSFLHSYCRHGNKEEVRKTGSEMVVVPIKRFELWTAHKCINIDMAASFEDEHSLNTASTFFMIC